MQPRNLNVLWPMFINFFSYFDQKNNFQKSGNVIWDHPEYVYNVTTAMMYLMMEFKWLCKNLYYYKANIVISFSERTLTSSKIWR